jgi:O-antigen biosynthesis protein WbqP
LDRPDKYVTKMGAFLRRFSLDEIPQLYNILKGEMSIVGPRPALWNQFDLINIRESYNVNSIRPGLTGWAQVNGRDELPIPVKAKFDKEYLDKESFLFDLGIILSTVKKALAGEGI